MKYTTEQGDMWDSICVKTYGDVIYTDILITANPQHKDVYVFGSGVVLDIPDIAEKTNYDDLPPWKQVQ